MLREAGAVEVHVRIASPPVKWPCFYGIDFATRAELVANGLEVDGVRASINADSLGYVSEQGLIAATEQPASRLCTACFTGQYPIPLGESEGSASTCSRGSAGRRCRWPCRRSGRYRWTGQRGRQCECAGGAKTPSAAVSTSSSLRGLGVDSTRASAPSR